MEHMAGEIDGWRARKEKIIEGFRTYSDATEWLRKWEDIYERVI
jgi:hypothetical protein